MVSNGFRAACLAVLVAFPCVACSDDDGGEDEQEDEVADVGTCNDATTSFSCTEHSGTPEFLETARDGCTGGGLTWTTEHCPTSNLLGCCRFTQGEVGYLECHYMGFSVTAMQLERDCIDILAGTWTTGARG